MDRHEWIDAILESGLSVQCRAIATVLYRCMKKDSVVVWPSMETISKRSGIGQRQTGRWFKKLKEEGWVSVQERSGRSSMITATTPVVEDTPVIHDTPVVEDRDPCHSVSKPLSCTTDEPLEPVKNQEKKSKPKEKFDTWYKCYPLKKAKGQAEKAFLKISPDQDLLNKMVKAVEAQAAWRERAISVGAFAAEWKYPATWLNARCWEDEMSEVVTRGKTNGKQTGQARVEAERIETERWARERDQELQAARLQQSG